VSDGLDLTTRRPAFALPIAIHNQVLLTLVMVGIGAVASSGFVSYAPNRLVSGTPIPLWVAAGGPPTVAIAALGAILLSACAITPNRPLHFAAAVAAGLLLLLVLAVVGQAASILASSTKPSSRISLGAASWVLVGCAMLAVADALQRLSANIGIQLITVIAIGTGVVVLAATGTFDALSIAREYESHRQVFAEALVQHIALVGASVAAALVIGFPLGVAAARNPRLQGPMFAILNILQTIPSIALFGLLIVPLSALVAAVPWLAALGIAGIGVAPAIIALVLYALLPIVRNTSAGLTGVDRAAVEAGRGMGLSGRQIFWQLELPLALPVLLAGLRIVIVQAIGLTVVAALIGAGGLGTFVFEGLGQYAVDLVLLGALPAIFLALSADFILQAIATPLRRRFAR
jgi:osmoprotectant transport system permease protein